MPIISPTISATAQARFRRSGEAERAALAAELAKRGFTDLLERIERSITTPSVWGARPNAAEADVLSTWKQLVALHRQWHSLTRELKDAETALGADNTEANYARLRDVKTRLSSLDGTEALIEGFGASSGRPSGPSNSPDGQRPSATGLPLTGGSGAECGLNRRGE